MKVFLDSNVIFSICWSGIEFSRSGLFFKLQQQGHIQLFISRLVHDETLFNLQTKRPESIPIFQKLCNELTIMPDNVGLTANQQIMRLPVNDRVIFMTALSNDMEYFITGNIRDFSDLYQKRIATLIALTPADFLSKKFEESK